MEYLSLGKVTDAFGLDGTLKIYSTTNMGEKRYQTGSKVFLYNPIEKSYEEHIVLSYRKSGLFDFVKLENISSIEDAILKKGQEICVVKNRGDLDQNTYFYSDLRGCQIYDENGNNIGFVKEIEEFPAQITFRVSRKNKPDFFVPFVNDFVKDIDVENKRIIIHVIEGLL